jgi:hypothetical protein
MSRLENAILDQHAATERLAKTVADDIKANGGSAREVIEALELLRGQLHRELDDLIDAEQLRRPSATPRFRVHRHRELEAPAA